MNIITARQLLEGFHSQGGGFLKTEPEEKGEIGDLSTGNVAFSSPFEFSTMEELQGMVKKEGKSIAQIVLENELSVRPKEEIEAKMKAVWDTMLACVADGVHSTAKELPGVLHVPRKAPGASRQLLKGLKDPFTLNPEDLKALKSTVGGNTAASEWVEVFAMAVNEENADGGRIITAPTNGSAGIIPAVLHYMYAFLDGDWEKVKTFFLTSFAVGYLCKKLASISGAEGGCQAEVGSACSMAAAGLCAVFGGSPRQIEKAAEIGIEHNLGLTCDPAAGLVQIPCIERNRHSGQYRGERGQARHDRAGRPHSVFGHRPGHHEKDGRRHALRIPEDFKGRPRRERGDPGVLSGPFANLWPKMPGLGPKGGGRFAGSAGGGRS